MRVAYAVLCVQSILSCCAHSTSTSLGCHQAGLKMMRLRGGGEVVKCRFRVRVALTKPGDKVVMIPAGAALQAHPSSDVALTTSEEEFPWWTTEVLVPVAGKIDYKFAIRDSQGGLTLKSGTNRVTFDFGEMRPRGAPVRYAPGRTSSWHSYAPRASRSQRRRLDQLCYFTISPLSRARCVSTANSFEGARQLRLRGGGVELVRCKFRVRVAHTQPGDKVIMLPVDLMPDGQDRCSGDEIHELTTNPQDFPWWSTEVLVPVGNKLEYKIAIRDPKGGLTPKPGTNHLRVDFGNSISQADGAHKRLTQDEPAEARRRGVTVTVTAFGRTCTWLARAAGIVCRHVRPSELLVNALLALALALPPVASKIMVHR